MTENQLLSQLPGARQAEHLGPCKVVAHKLRNGMIEVRRTDEFANWLKDLRDIRAAARIEIRITRVSLGNLGEAKFFDGIGELKIDYGPGYRLYFIQRGKELVILLCGGDKSSQQADISKAKHLAQEV